MLELISRSWWKRYARDFDYMLLLMLICISVYSLVAIYSATAKKPDLSGVFPHEAFYQLICYVALCVFMVLDYRVFKHRWQWIGYFGATALCVAVFLFPAIKGAHSWISLGGFQLQPSEFVKVFIIMAIADYMAKEREREQEFGIRQFLFMTLVTLIPFALVYKEPALGQALVILSIWCTFLLLFLRTRILIASLAICAVLVGGFVVSADVYPMQTMAFVDHKLPIKQYQKDRIKVFIDPTLDPSGKGFQVSQAMTAVGAGQIFGRGLLKGSQTQHGWVPEQQTDFIFSAIAEELGFVGSGILLFCFFVLLYRMMRIAAKAGDYFGTFFIYGAMGMFAFQIFENIGMNLSITPSTGITLPFVSYGGSSLLTNFMVMGLVLSIAVRRRKLVF